MRVYLKDTEDANDDQQAEEQFHQIERVAHDKRLDDRGKETDRREAKQCDTDIGILDTAVEEDPVQGGDPADTDDTPKIPAADADILTADGGEQPKRHSGYK